MVWPGRRGWAFFGVVVLLSIVSWFVLGGVTLNYDAQWALDWGQALARGDAPDYETQYAPTAHPFVTVIAWAATLVFGHASPDVLHAIAHISHAVLIVVSVLLAARLFGKVAAVVTAVGIAACAPISENVALGFQDVTAAAFIMSALLAEVTNRNRPAVPFVLLAIGGTVRPEVWLITGAYWLYRCWRASWAERAKFTALAALGPFLWMLSDLIVTGNPVVSFTRTRDGAEAAQRVTGLSEGPSQLIDNLKSGLGTVWIAGAFAGAVIVLVCAWRRDTRLARFGQLRLVALGALLVIGFMVLAAGELSLLERYLIALMAVVVVLFAFAVGGWLRLERSTVRWVWLALAVLIAARALLTIPDQIDRAEAVVDYGRHEDDALDRLDTLMRASAVRRVVDDCGAAAASSYRITPYAAFGLEHAPKEVPEVKRPEQLGRAVAWIAPRSDRAAAFTALGRRVPVPAAPPGARVAAGNSDWVVYAVGC